MKCGLINEAKTEVVRTFEFNGSNLILIGGIRGRLVPEHFTLELLKLHGWLPIVEPAAKTRFHNLDDYIIEADRITYELIEHDIESVRVALISETEILSDSKVEVIAPARKVGRFNGLANQLNSTDRKHLKAKNEELEERIKKLEDSSYIPKLVNVPNGITQEQEQLVEQLEAIQEITEAIREAEDAIVEEIKGNTFAELIYFNMTNHPAWP